MMVADSGSTNPPSSSTGTRPAGGLSSISQSGRRSRSISTVSYPIPFSASTMRTRAQ